MPNGVGLARNKLTLESASKADPYGLGFWYDLAGAMLEKPQRQIEDLIRAHAGGYLGYAIGNGRRSKLARLLSLMKRVIALA